MQKSTGPSGGAAGGLGSRLARVRLQSLRVFVAEAEKKLWVF